MRNATNETSILGDRTKLEKDLSSSWRVSLHSLMYNLPGSNSKVLSNDGQIETWKSALPGHYSSSKLYLSSIYSKISKFSLVICSK